LGIPWALAPFDTMEFSSKKHLSMKVASHGG